MKKVLIFILSLMIIMVPTYVYAVDEPGTGETPTDPTTPEPSPSHSPTPDPGQGNEENLPVMTLEYLNITGGSISPIFNPTTYTYTITVSKPEDF